MSGSEESTIILKVLAINIRKIKIISIDILVFFFIL